MKDLLFLTILFFVVLLWAGSSGARAVASRRELRRVGSNPTPPNLILGPAVPTPIPTPTPSGRWVFYKRNKITYYEETGNPTALGNEYITGPMDSLAAVDREDRWLLEKWLLVKWDGGEFVVWAGDICGGCSDHGVALDISPGLYGRKKPPPVVDVYYWEEG